MDNLLEQSMRSTLIAAFLGIGFVPAMALGQTAQPPTAPQQTAAIEAAAPTPPSAPGAMTRDRFIQRAKDRAGERAGVRFDQMDADHDGVLDRAEIRAWRSQHPRRAAAAPSRPASQ
jgi:hypothetical protein